MCLKGGIYEHVDRAMCTAIGTVTWVHTKILFFLNLFYIILKNISGYEYGIEHEYTYGNNTNIIQEIHKYTRAYIRAHVHTYTYTYEKT